MAKNFECPSCGNASRFTARCDKHGACLTFTKNEKGETLWKGVDGKVYKPDSQHILCLECNSLFLNPVW